MNMDIYLNLQQLSLWRGFKQYFKKSYLYIEGCANFGVTIYTKASKNNTEIHMKLKKIIALIFTCVNDTGKCTVEKAYLAKIP
jgi:hypothetical protein